jgi:hypothetical protein
MAFWATPCADANLSLPETTMASEQMIGTEGTRTDYVTRKILAADKEVLRLMNAAYPV